MVSFGSATAWTSPAAKAAEFCRACAGWVRLYGSSGFTARTILIMLSTDSAAPLSTDSWNE